MRLSRIAFVLSLSLILAACGGSDAVSYPPTGSATSSGALRGDTLAPTDAVSGTVTTTSNGTSSNISAVVITNETGVCGEALAGTASKSKFILIFALAELSSSGSAAPASGPGSFTVVTTSAGSATRIAAVSYQKTDDSCHTVAASIATGKSGTVTLNAVSSSQLSGSYDITFDSGDRVTGTFTAANCAAFAALAGSGGRSTAKCQ